VVKKLVVGAAKQGIAERRGQKGRAGVEKGGEWICQWGGEGGSNPFVFVL
jgi:hypothetical protein